MAQAIDAESVEESGSLKPVVTLLLSDGHDTEGKGDALVLDSTMTFSLSANPSLQFNVAEDAPGDLSAHVHDNKDNEFEQPWSAATGTGDKTTDDGTTS